MGNWFGMIDEVEHIATVIEDNSAEDSKEPDSDELMKRNMRLELDRIMLMDELKNNTNYKNNGRRNE